MPRPVTFMSALGFTDQDLAANREGRLGPRQLFNARFYAAVWSIMGWPLPAGDALAVALWAQLNRDDHTATDIVAVFAFAIVIGGTCFALAFRKLRGSRRTAPATCLTCKVRPH